MGFLSTPCSIKNPTAKEAAALGALPAAGFCIFIKALP